ncbi:peroxidase [Marchantia polymorpha subsp. ruderalis]|nr:hypothetical protein MARPO_0088s0020 [Marchantia polymorpha]BBN16000.1 hypothetical protein Mp_7g02680 [Marchantia polymorpha subsp. ruderalis]|eukprot:PTQ33471.1 hypothetical protein MARPO_0088s0020 [Marchantia polymorpha]
MTRRRSACEMRIATLFLLVLCSGYLSAIQAQLSPTFYAATCPNLERIARQWFSIGVLNALTAPAAILRLSFHDCSVNGCDASVLLNAGRGNTDEKASSLNLGISNLQVIDGIKTAVERQCPGVVSCADLLVLAARDAVSLSGGPRMTVQLGRRDGTTASTSAADSQLLPPTASVDRVLSTFSQMGLTPMETVALLGSHTMGVGHCDSIKNRLYPQLDTTLSQNPFFAQNLKRQCPASFSNPNTVVANDITNIVFDNQYFRDVQGRRGLFSIDDAIRTDARTSGFVRQFAVNRQLFFSTFQTAYNKMAAHRVLTGTQGQIRKNCRSIN